MTDVRWGVIMCYIAHRHIMLYVEHMEHHQPTQLVRRRQLKLFNKLLLFIIRLRYMTFRLQV